jgi:hypothetical protein
MGMPKPVSSEAELRARSGFTDPAAITYADMAFEIAGKQWPITVSWRCAKDIIHVESGLPPPPPTKVFDNLYYIGYADVGSWVLKTSDGIILFDTLNNENDAKNMLVPGLVKLGLDPSQVKYALITHEHGDHYGGAPYFKRTYGTKIGMSQIAWDAKQLGAAKPVKAADDLVLNDGGSMTLGDTKVTFVLTPGHTLGTVSFIFPIKENGATHMVAEWGGNGTPGNYAGREQFRQSVEHFAQYTERAHVDAEVIAHGDNDNLLHRLEVLRARKPGDPNPFLIGRETYLRYETALNLCTMAEVAQSLADEKVGN